LLLKLKGTLITGKSGDIRFNEIEEFIHKKQVYSYLRNISQLKTQESEIKSIQNQVDDVKDIEQLIQKEFSSENPHIFNEYLPELMNALSVEKSEEEKSSAFETRLIEELKNRLNLNGAL
jgi:flagellar hook-associated protein FlgK